MPKGKTSTIGSGLEPFSHSSAVGVILVAIIESHGWGLHFLLKVIHRVKLLGSYIFVLAIIVYRFFSVVEALFLVIESEEGSGTRPRAGKN